MCIGIIIIIFLLVTWLLNIWTVSNKNINYDRVWVLGLGECDSGTEECKVCRGEEVSARVCYSQKLWKPLPDSEKSVWDGPMTCHQCGMAPWHAKEKNFLWVK